MLRKVKKRRTKRVKRSTSTDIRRRNQKNPRREKKVTRIVKKKKRKRKDHHQLHLHPVPPPPHHQALHQVQVLDNEYSGNINIENREHKNICLISIIINNFGVLISHVAYHKTFHIHLYEISSHIYKSLFKVLTSSIISSSLSLLTNRLE